MSSKFYLISNRHLQPYNPLNVGFEYCVPGHAFGPKTRRHYLLHYVAAGSGVFRHNGKAYDLTARMCFVIRPGEITYYKASDADPWHYIWIGFSTTLPLPDCIEIKDVFDAGALGDLFLEIEEKRLYWNGEIGNNGMREAYLCGKITELVARLWMIQNAHRETKAESAAQIAKNYMDNEFASGITVSELADRLHHERTYFSRMFKAAIGVSPQVYLKNKRLEEAARLMEQCDFTPTEAAAAVGYADLFSFSKMFKKHFGVPPSKFSAKRKP